jgi:hypothetical protein
MTFFHLAAAPGGFNDCGDTHPQERRGRATFLLGLAQVRVVCQIESLIKGWQKIPWVFSQASSGG